jgi:hypothetical protein
LSFGYGHFVRSTGILIAIPILAAGGLFWWQRSQIAALRAVVVQQGYALQDDRMQMDDLSRWLSGSRRHGLSAQSELASTTRPKGLRRSDDDSAALRSDERSVIVDQYRDVLAQMALPRETASRLLDLLTDRIDAVLDAQDAAMREGYAEGSAETARAVALAVAGVDREIATLVGVDGGRRLDGFAPTLAPEPVAPPAQTDVPTVVNVVVQNSPAPSYADMGVATEPSAAYPSYYPYAFYPVTTFWVGRRTPPPFSFHRNGIERAHRR